eukprot:TRINITY_DN3755_c0_g1_i1.p1 TRINITY_DN3755_c0_g1~~TRINITY_DN3755_c0_g1_i1.p1  ORF type:complete len:289 (+),score=19.15 TRINITY_DN3755_c0_g1_i1:56-922(+)
MTGDSSGTRVNGRAFYAQYHGHPEGHLRTLIQAFRGQGHDSLVMLAGDSSLDNKYWIHSRPAPAIGPYNTVLHPRTMKRDVSYYLNLLGRDQHIPFSNDDGTTSTTTTTTTTTTTAPSTMRTSISSQSSEDTGTSFPVTVNCAVEEATLGSKSKRLNPQDEVVRDMIGEEDILVVSVGGNDIALSPTLGTIFSALQLIYCNSQSSIEAGPSKAWGMGHFIRMFKRDIEAYLTKLTEKTKPKLVVVCMIYFLDEQATGGWADGVLRKLQYDSNPGKLQAAIQAVCIIYP